MVEDIIKSALNEALKELDYGQNLFADPTVKQLPTQRGVTKFPPQDKYKEFLHGDSESPNTEEEMRVLTDIVNFTRENYNDIEDFKNNAQELLALKSKFPKMLDPKQGENTGKLVYRGATIPISVLQKLSSKINPVIGRQGLYTIENPGIKITPSSGRGIHSFSAKLLQALDFMDMTAGKHNRMEGRIPVVFAIDSSEPNLLLNPDFLDALSIFGEQEVMLIGDSFTPKEIYIDPAVLEWRLSDKEKEELNKILPKRKNVDEGEIEEGKQVGILYHYTSLKAADKILKDGFIQGSDKAISGYSDNIIGKNYYSLSLTRDKNFHKVYRVIGEYPECRFVIDGDVLSNKYKIQPVAARGFEKKKSKDFEAEEVIVSPSQIKVPVKPYVKSIDLLIEPAGDLKVGDYDPYEFIEVLKKLKDQGIAVNAVDKNGNSAPTDLKLSFSQWLKKSIQKAKLTENKQLIPEIGEGTARPFPYKITTDSPTRTVCEIQGETSDGKKVNINLYLIYTIFSKEGIDITLEYPGGTDERFLDFLQRPENNFEDGLRMVSVLFEIRPGSEIQVDDAFGEVNDLKYMFRLMATIKQIILAKDKEMNFNAIEFTPSEKDMTGDEGEGRRKLYGAFIKKMFPNSKEFRIDDVVYHTW